MKAVVAAVAVAIAAGCSKSAPKLDGALSAIPVYAPSTLDDTRPYFDKWRGEDHAMKAIEWKLQTADDWKLVDSFYSSKLPPHAVRREGSKWTGDPDDVHYDYVPPGFDEGEHVTIAIHRTTPAGVTRFEIAEVVAKAKR